MQEEEGCLQYYSEVLPTTTPTTVLLLLILQYNYSNYSVLLLPIATTLRLF